MFENYEQITGKKAEIANFTVRLVMKAMQTSLPTMQCAGEKAALLGGCAIPSLTGLTFLFGKQDDIDERPAVDDIIFGAVYMIVASEDHSDGIIVQFSPQLVTEAARLFAVITGREYTNIHPGLLSIIREAEAEAKKVPEHVRSFLPQ